jgi:hypothetical protein
MTETKICASCGLEKQLNEFLPLSWSKDGRRKKCKVCTHEERKAKIVWPRAIRKIRAEWKLASNAVSNAIKTGTLSKASSYTCKASIFCGKQAEHYHHPRGYSEEHRLDVVPVCSSCHVYLHNNPAKLRRRMVKCFGKEMYLPIK